MYSPSALVVVLRVPRVAVLVTVTLAPGIGAPDESVTVPVIAALRLRAAGHDPRSEQDHDGE